MNTDELLLSDGFEPPSHQAWVELATNALRGRSPDTLRTTTYDGFGIAALHSDSGLVDPAGLPGNSPYTRGTCAAGHGDAWDVRQLHADPDLGRANRSVLNDLESGATSLLLDLDRLGVESVDDLDRLLDGVHLDLAAVHLLPNASGASGATRLVALWDKRGVPKSVATGGLGVDPLGVAARTGQPASLEDVYTAFRAGEQFDSVSAVVVDLTPYADAGASDAQEIAYSLATGVEYLRALTNAEVSIDDALGALTFSYSLGADQFAGIAKLRAARTVWARVAAACGATSDVHAQRQHGVTASSMMTVADPWVNLMRVTVACFAAAIGGAQAITVRPFDSAVGVSDEFARRIARNTQLLLLEESNLARVTDPAGGSWFVEQLTTDLADAAWSRFQVLEAAGGMKAALESGLIDQQVSGVASERFKRASSREDPITGVTEYPNVDEVPLVRPPASEGLAGGLEVQRLAQPFEALRSTASAAGAKPVIFLAKLGAPADFTARSRYAQNFFEVAGIVGIGDAGFDSPVAVAASFAESAARVAVICSSDELYGERATATAEALKASGAERIYLAGRPGDRQDEYTAAGVDEFIHLGVDVLEVLQRAHEVLGLGGSR